MINYLLTSTFIHAIILLGLCSLPNVLTSESPPVSVTLIEREQKPFELPTSRKSLIPRPGSGQQKNNPKIDLKDYSDRLKAIIDPIFVKNLGQNNYHNLNVILLLSVNSYGKIVNVIVQKSSGNKGYDKLAVDSIWEAKEIPAPSEELVKLGIEWSFST